MDTQLLSDNVAKLVKPTALILPLMGVLITGIFILDLVSPLGRIVWLLYFLPLFLTFWFSHRQYLIPLATVCTALIIVGYIHASPGTPVETVAFNRSIGVLVLWITTLLLRQHKRVEEALRKAHEQLERRVEERTSELRRTIDLLKREDAERKQAEEALRESRERFRSAFGSAAIGMALVAPDGRWLQVNRALREIVGYSEQELLATTFQAITHPDDLEADLEYVRQMLAGEFQTYQMEKRYFHKLGRIVWILLSVSLVRDAHGTPLYFISQIQDITERKRVEEKLLLYREIIANANDEIAILDLQGRFTYQNSAHALLVGFSDDELLGKTPAILLGDEAFSSICQELARAQSYRGELTGRTKDGVPKNFELSMFTIRDTAGAPVCFVGIKRDITERKWAEKVLQALLEGTASVTGEQFFPALVQSIARALGVRHAFVTELLGDERPRLRILAIWMGDRLGSPIEYDLVHTPCEDVIKQGKAYYPDSVQELFPKDKDLVALGAVSYLGIALVDGSGKTIGHLCILDDKPLPDEHRIASLLKVFASRAAAELERKRGEEALRASEERFKAFMDNSPAAAFMKDEDGRYTYINKLIEHRFNSKVSDWLGKTDYDLWPAETAKQLREHDRSVLAQNKTLELYETIPDARGDQSYWLSLKFPVKDSAGRRFLGGVSLDITDRKLAEDALRESEQQLRLALEERVRLSQDLHDNIIQTIYAIGMGLEDCQQLITEDTTATVKKLRYAIAQLNIVIRDVRNYIVVEEPDRISAVQLRTELTKLAKAINEAHSLRFRINLDPLAANQLTPEETKHVLSIAHEAMSNGLRHSGARTGVVSLQMENGALRLIVEDSGVGFDAQTLKARGQGLRNIAARAQKLGAHFQVISERGRGTRILVDIPKEQVHASAGD